MDDSCAVCADALEWVGYGSCGHREVCSTCVVRLRFILNDNRCCICKTDNPFVFITKAIGDYTRVITDFSGVTEGKAPGGFWYHEGTQSYFDDVDQYRMIKVTCKLSCSVCDKNTEEPGARRPYSFRDIDQLRAHLFHQHKLLMCNLCLKGRKTEKCGSGVIAEEDIKQGDFVIEYVGEVIDDKTCEERLWRMKRCGETYFFLCEINCDMVIDATYKGNKSRYINHSCQPNTQMQKWTIDGETRIGIFAIHDIRKGEELTYDYQYVQFGADQDCYCGAIECRQKLGFKPNKLNFSSSDAALQFVL